MLGFVMSLASWVRSVSTARWKKEISGRITIKVGNLEFFDGLWKDRRSRNKAAEWKTKKWDVPFNFLVEFATHILGELFELTLRLGIVRVNDEKLQLQTTCNMS